MIYTDTIKATDVRITQLTLVSPSGTSVGLLNIMAELNIFEDLFSSVMTGNIVLNDSQNLINNLPITGYEFLLLSFEKPGIAVKMSKTFRVYKMTDRIRVNEQNETYILHFASEELLISESVLVSRTYTNMPISAIVAEISKQFLRIQPEKLAFIRETYGTHTINIPGYHPFHALNHVARYALSQYKAGAFVFYESRDGYHFDSLEAMSEQTPAQLITIAPKNLGYERSQKSDLQQEQEGAESISFPECFDTLRSTYDGMYGGLLVTIDPLRQRIKHHYYDGLKQFTNTKHVNRFPFMSGSQNRFGRAQYEYPEALKRVVLTTKDHDQIPYAQGKQLIRPSRIEEWLIPRLMYLTGIHSNRVSVAIPGSLIISVGSVIELKLPAAEEQEKGTKKLDALYTGRYLVTALRHKVNQRTYSCIAELSKDSINTVSLNSSNALQDIKRQ